MKKISPIPPAAHVVITVDKEPPPPVIPSPPTPIPTVPGLPTVSNLLDTMGPRVINEDALNGLVARYDMGATRNECSLGAVGQVLANHHWHGVANLIAYLKEGNVVTVATELDNAAYTVLCHDLIMAGAAVTSLGTSKNYNECVEYARVLPNCESYNLILVSVGDNPISTIKAVRQLYPFSTLSVAKKLVDEVKLGSRPTLLLANVPKLVALYYYQLFKSFNNYCLIVNAETVPAPSVNGGSDNKYST